MLKQKFIVALSERQRKYLDARGLELGISRAEMVRRILDQKIDSEEVVKRGPGRPRKPVEEPALPTEPVFAFFTPPVGEKLDWTPSIFMQKYMMNSLTSWKYEWDPQLEKYQDYKEKTDAFTGA